MTINLKGVNKMNQIFEMYPGLKRFIENKPVSGKQLTPKDFCNMYVIQTEDRDGNITGEAYATNVITNAGMSEIYKSGVNSRYSDIYPVYCIGNIQLGSGTTTPTVSDRALEEPLNVSGTLYADLTTYACQYDPNTDIIYQHRNMGYVVFDYNISGITEDITINEIGLFTLVNGGNNAMTAHMLVYDENHNLGITKHTNEKMTIHVFFAAGMKASIISDLWTNKQYLIINPAKVACLGSYSTNNRNSGYSGLVYTVIGSAVNTHRLDNNKVIYGTTIDTGTYDVSKNIMYYGTMAATQEPIFTYKRTALYNIGGRVSNGSFSGDVSIRTDPKQQMHFMMYTSNTSVENDYGYINNSGMPFALFQELWLPNNGTETVSIQTLYTNDCQSLEFDKQFGGVAWNSDTWNGQVPILDYNISSSYMYNCANGHKGWNIADDYNNYPNAYYGQMGRFGFEFKSSEGDVMVHCNNKAGSLRISSIVSTDTKQIYCTDKYWDPTTYVDIPDITNIPDDSRNLGKKKYYLQFNTSGENVNQYYTFKYAQDVHSYNGTANVEFPITLTDAVKYVGGKLITSETYNCVVLADKLIYIDNNTNTISATYSLPFVVDGTNYWADLRDQYICGKYLLQWSMGPGPISCIRIYDISNSSQAPTYIDLDFRTDNGQPFMQNEKFRTTNGTYSPDGYCTYWSHSEEGYFSAFDPVNNTGYVLDLNQADIPNDGVMKFSNVKFLHIQEFTSYLLYMDIGTAVNHWHVVDMSDGTETTFDLPEDYESDGIFGCGSYVYISTTSNFSFVYNIDNDTLVRIDKIGYTKWHTPVANEISYKSSVQYTEGDSSVPLYSKHGIMLVRFHVTNGVRYINLDEDYTNVITIETGSAYTLEFNAAQLMTFKNDATHEEQLLYVSPNNMYCGRSYGERLVRVCNTGASSWDMDPRLRVFDFGYVLDNGWTDIPYYRSYNAITGYTDRDSGGFLPGQYRRGIMMYDSTNNKIVWNPIECFVPHYVTGTTHSITTYHNPKQIKAGAFEIKLTNDPTVYDLPT
jgi:hypothetical protein